jgi:SMODS-associating 2TM, beta-strand rich effector domain
MVFSFCLFKGGSAMAKLLGLRFWIFCAVFLTASGMTFWPWTIAKLSSVAPLLGSYTSPTPNFQVLASIVWSTIAAFFLIWKQIWKLPIIGPWLSRIIFPDLNGEWKVVVNSNWPIIDKMRNAAKDKKVPRFDPVNEAHLRPDLLSTEFIATIEQKWLSTEITFKHNQKTPLLNSIPLSADLIGKEGAEPKRLAMIYRQANSPLPAHTDEHSFLGAALLRVSDDGKTLQGNYWTNRSWDKGLNAAGEIILTRAD